MKRTISAAALGALIVGASVLGTASAASALTYWGPYDTYAQCVAAQGVREFHGYIIAQGCYERWGYWFITE